MVPFVDLVVLRELWISEGIRGGLAVVVGIDVMREDGLMVYEKGRKWLPFYKLDYSCSLELDNARDPR